MADYEFNTTPEDSKGRGHKAVDPTKYTDMAQYLEAIMAEARKTNDNSILGDYLLNIMAARDYMDVKPNNLDGLKAMHLSDSDEEMPEKIAEGIQRAHMDLVENEVMQEFLLSRDVDYLKGLVSSGGHGGKLERDVKKFVLAYKGPIPEETPERYTPTALTRIEVLQKQLKGLKRNDPEFKERATSICMEIAATRAAVDCKRGDKSTLKHKYDLDKMNRHYNALMKTAGKDLSDENLNRLMRGAQDARPRRHDGEGRRGSGARGYAAQPPAPGGGRAGALSGDLRIKMLRGEISRAMKDGSPEAKQKLKSALAEMPTLSGHGMDEKLRPDEKVQKIAASKSFDRFVDELMQDEGKRSVLGDALSRDENYGQKVARFVAPAYEEATKEMALTSEKLTTEEREKRLSERTEELKKNFAEEDRQVEGKKGTELRGEMAKELNFEANNLAMLRDADDKPISLAESLRRMRELFDKQMAMTHAYNKSIDKNTGRVNEQEYARQLNGSRFQLNLEEVRQDPTYQKMMENMIQENSVDKLLLPMSIMVKNPEKLQSRYQAELQKQEIAGKENAPGLNKKQVKEEELNLI